jgi:hypothetical protein
MLFKKNKHVGGYIGSSVLPESSFISSSANGAYSPNEINVFKKRAKWPILGEADTNFSNVVFLLAADGIDGSVVLNDSSSYDHRINIVGNAELRTDIKKFGSSSLYVFGGSANADSLSNNNWNFNTNDFTIECWIYPTAGIGASRDILSKFTTLSSNLDFLLEIDGANGNLKFSAGNNATISILSNAAIRLNDWTNVAVSRVSGVTRMFIDGVVQSATHTGSVSINNNTTALTIGKSSTNSDPFSGYIDEIRITSNVGRYSSSFTPYNGRFSNFGLDTTPTPTASSTSTPTPTATGTPNADITAEYLVVAGGGSGGGPPTGGGGGAGGLLTGTSVLTTGVGYTIAVGKGGAAVNYGRGNSGKNSSFQSFVAVGGGGAGHEQNNPGLSGGSGGGGVSTGGSRTLGQGNVGGSGYIDGGGTSIGGGGGGSGSAGSDAFAATGGNGTPISITGQSVIYAAGGGGGGRRTGYGLGGSSGVGGMGGDGEYVGMGGGGGPGPTSGAANTGSCCGGAGSNYDDDDRWDPTSGAGAGGVVVIAVAGDVSATVTGFTLGTTYTRDTSTRNGYTVFRFIYGGSSDQLTGTITLTSSTLTPTPTPTATPTAIAPTLTKIFNGTNGSFTGSGTAADPFVAASYLGGYNSSVRFQINSSGTIQVRWNATNNPDDYLLFGFRAEDSPFTIRTFENQGAGTDQAFSFALTENRIFRIFVDYAGSFTNLRIWSTA